LLSFQRVMRRTFQYSSAWQRAEAKEHYRWISGRAVAVHQVSLPGSIDFQKIKFAQAELA
jgi:hypothetical protein